MKRSSPFAIDRNKVQKYVQQPLSIGNLINDCLLYIFKFLTKNDIRELYLISRCISIFAQSDFVWKPLFRDEFTAKITDNYKENYIKYTNMNNFMLRSKSININCAQNLIIIDLGHKNLSYIPKEIGLLIQLQKLRLDYNKLMFIPTDIGLLTQLKTLKIRNNSLQGLPKGIELLTNLQFLDLTHNQLQVIPSEIMSLTNLQELSLGDNQLRSIPSGIGSLKQLRQLTVDHNQLLSISPQIQLLTQLRILHLSFNKLKFIPREIKLLTQLEILNVEMIGYNDEAKFGYEYDLDYER